MSTRTALIPGIHAEERGQAEAIAYNLREMARLEVPIIATVIGVGGSGGALAIAVADRVLMMENSIYSVISPEGCAAIMWRDATKKELAAEAMRITATDCSELGCIDDIVPEPEGGAHRDHEAAANLLDVSLQKHLCRTEENAPAELVASRYNKFRTIAQFLQDRVVRELLPCVSQAGSSRLQTGDSPRHRPRPPYNGVFHSSCNP